MPKRKQCDPLSQQRDTSHNQARDTSHNQARDKKQRPKQRDKSHNQARDKKQLPKQRDKSHVSQRSQDMFIVATNLEPFLSKRDCIWMKYVCQLFSKQWNKWKSKEECHPGSIRLADTDTCFVGFPSWSTLNHVDTLPDRIQRISSKTSLLVSKWPASLVELDTIEYPAIPFPPTLTRLRWASGLWNSKYVFPPQLLRLHCCAILSGVVLPPLVSLELSYLHDDFQLPVSLQHLRVANGVFPSFVKQLSGLTNLVTLSLNVKLELMDCPLQLKELTVREFNSDYQDAIKYQLETLSICDHSLGENIWIPSTLHTLKTNYPEWHLHRMRHGCITALETDRLTYLGDSVFPTITSLKLHESYDDGILFIFPNLVSLSILTVLQGIPALPSTLQKLYLGRFDQPLAGLPPNLKVLDLGNQFNQPFGANELPSSLTRLELGAKFQQPLRFLPAGLKQLILPAGYIGRIPPDIDVRYRES